MQSFKPSSKTLNLIEYFKRNHWKEACFGLLRLIFFPMPVQSLGNNVLAAKIADRKYFSGKLRNIIR